MAGVQNMVKKWGGKAILSISEQGIVSGANFALNILLARWLSPSEYGAFAIAFSLFLLLSLLHNALILEPMNVIGIVHYRGRIPSYLMSTAWIQTGISIGLALLLTLLAAGMGFNGSSLTPSLFSLAIATPFILLFWFLRRLCYLEIRPELALRGSVFYTLFLLLGIVGMWQYHLISPFNAFLVMAAASGGASVVFSLLFHSSLKGLPLETPNLSQVKGVMVRHWSYGRWIIGSSLVGWIASIIYTPLIGAFVGLEEVGGFRAMENLLLPMDQTLTALTILLLPWFSKQRGEQGSQDLKKTVINTGAVIASLTCAYVAVILMTGGWITRTLYGGEYYSAFLNLLPYLGGVVIIRGAFLVGFGVALSAAERSDILFWSALGGAVITLTLGVFLVWYGGILGAAVGRLASAVVQLGVSLWWFRHLVKGRDFYSVSKLSPDCGQVGAL